MLWVPFVKAAPPSTSGWIHPQKSVILKKRTYCFSTVIPEIVHQSSFVFATMFISRLHTKSTLVVLSLISMFSFQAPAAVVEAIQDLKSVCGEENVSTSMSVREHHGHDESYHESMMPSAVLFPQNVEQVSEIAQLCYSKNIHMVPFGTGTGLEGGVSATEVRCFFNCGVLHNLFQS